MGDIVNWRSTEFLPKSDGSWAVQRLPWRNIKRGESTVMRAIWQWQPWDPVLISVPESNFFQPPICVSSLERKVHKNMLFQYRLLLMLLIFLTAASVLVFSNTGTDVFFRASALGVLFLAFVLIQYISIFNKIDRLRDLSLFVVWIYQQKTFAISAVVIGMVFLGGLQYILQERSGSFDGLMQDYGLVFDLARHQWWRYLVGPFLHSGLVHWTSNFILLSMAAGLSATIGKRPQIIWIFIIGAIIPCVVESGFAPDFREYGVVGLSGGILALFGWTSGVSIRYKKWFPAGFWLHVTSFSVVIVVSVSLINHKADDTVHVVGLLIGLLLGISKIGVKRGLSDAAVHQSI
jgi:membrane associated rhomboid family serine protease